MPIKVNLRPGTKVLISGHSATLCTDGEFEFDLPTAQAVGESLMNDAENFALNRHLIDEPEDLWCVSPDTKEAEPEVRVDTEGAIYTKPVEAKNAEKKVAKKSKQPSKKAVKKPKATSKPVVAKAKTKAKKGKK